MSNGKRSMVLLTVGALCLAGSVFGQNGKIVLFDIPNAFSLSTAGINAFGTIVGQYVVRQDLPNYRGGIRGFIRGAGGTITTVEVPDSVWTFAYAINSSGTMAGVYLTRSGGINHGYMRDAKGNLTLFEPYTWVADINDLGEVTGWTGFPPFAQSQGFVRDAGGNVTFFNSPGSSSTAPSAINVHGTITGSYSNSSGWHGFVRERSGAITTFDVPGSTSTAPNGINAGGTIFGSYYEAQNSHSFVRDPRGNFTTFSTNRSCPGNPIVVGMNDFGVVVFKCGGDVFVRETNGVTLQIVAPPDSGCQSITPTGINRVGVVAGYCTTSSPATHGFIWMP